MTNGTRRRWGVSITPWPLFTPRKDPVPIVQEAGWAPGPVWTGAENLALTGIRSLDCPARNQSLYRLRYPAHPMRRADNLTTFMCRLSWNLGASLSWKPQGLSRPLVGLLYLYLYIIGMDLCIAYSKIQLRKYFDSHLSWNSMFVFCISAKICTN